MEEELARGWIVKANTIEELAEKIGIDPAALTTTVTKYNQYCEQGNDLDFHRASRYLKAFAPQGPYYAFSLKAANTNTQGGARRTVQCEIVDVWGDVIPHLYGAGEFGSFYADIYNGGGNLSECGFTGRRAGENAAKVKNDVSQSSVMGGKKAVDFRAEVPVFTTGPNEYIGTGSGMGGDLIVKIKLDSAKKITDIEYLWQHETRGIADRAIAQIPQAIIRAQNTNVDTVTGATLTSKAIIAAVNDALSKAR
jgi:uncharacterized protein with FMN-binding domain